MMTILASATRWLLSGGWKWAGMAVLALALMSYRHSAQTWHKAYDAQRSAYVAAQAEAAVRQLQANLAATARYSAIRSETDAEHTKALEGARSAASRYIAGHRLRPGDKCPASGVAAPAEGANPGGVESAGGQAELVAVTAEDINICSTNTARLQSAREWGQRLIDAGMGE